MIKPVKCARCGKRPQEYRWGIDTDCDSRSGFTVSCDEIPINCGIFVNSYTRFDAILRWNICQWREARRMKKERKKRRNE